MPELMVVNVGAGGRDSIGGLDGFDGNPGSTGANGVGAGPKGIAYDATNGDFYVTNSLDGTVSVINTNTNTNAVTDTITVGRRATGDGRRATGDGPEGITYDPASGDFDANNLDGGTTGTGLGSVAVINPGG